MKLIIIYGPPAAGKLTIAKELSKTADVQVFDNHQVIDMVEPLVTRSYPDFAKLIYATQRSIIGAAVRANEQNVVITFPYAANLDRDTAFMNEVISDARSGGADVYPVFLRCDRDTLRSRATEESRKKYGKITTIEVMNQMIEKYELWTPLDIEGGTSLDTTKLSAEEAALAIKQIADL
jgi:tRNA uridine 5-carbamoylmethylation protein Kti12